MAPGIDVSDTKAWDDSSLVRSWNEALREYEKHHSIQISGKRLEDVLSEEEMKNLREDYGTLIGQSEGASNDASRANGSTHDENTAVTEAKAYDVEESTQMGVQQVSNTFKQEPIYPTSTGGPTLCEDPPDLTMPQAVLRTVQDENLKNMMMSWYYAGYYTGLHVGQQQAAREVQPKD